MTRRAIATPASFPESKAENETPLCVACCSCRGFLTCQCRCTPVRDECACCLHDRSFIRRCALRKGCGPADPASLHGQDDDSASGVSPDQAALSILKGIENKDYLIFTSTDIQLGYWGQRKFTFIYDWVMQKMNELFQKALMGK